MTQPNPKDPQAELPKGMDLIISETMIHTSGVIKKCHNPAVHPPEMQQELDAIYHEALADLQAHQQQLLSELLGELPKKELPEIKRGALIIEHEGKLVKTENLAKMRNTGFNQAIDQVVSAIEKYREGL